MVVAEVASCHRDVPLLDDDHAADIDATVVVVVHGTDEGLQHNAPEDDDDYHTPNDDDTHYYFDTIVVHTHVHVVVDQPPTRDHVPMPLESIVDRPV